MSLLATRFAPDSPRATNVVIHYKLQLLGFIRLVYDCFNHGDSFLEVLVAISRHKYVQRLVFAFIGVENSRLGTLTSDWNLTFWLFLQLLLRCTRWTNNLTYEINARIVGVRNEDFLLFFRRFVIYWWHVSRVNRQHFVYKSKSLLDVPVFVTLIPRIWSESSFGIINRFWRRRPDIWVVWLEILNSDTLLQIINPVATNPHLYFLLWVWGREVAETLRSKCFQMCWLPAPFQPWITLCWIFPPVKTSVGLNV